MNDDSNVSTEMYNRQERLVMCWWPTNLHKPSDFSIFVLQVFRTHPLGLLLGFFLAKVLSQWGERDQVNVQYKVKKLKLLCKFVIIIDVVKTIHRWGLDFSILKYVWDLKCFKWQNDNHVQGVNHCMRASTTPELLLGQPSRANREPRSCQLGKYMISQWKFL